MESSEPERQVYDPFYGAEAAVEEVVNEILTEGGRQIYETYIEKKSFAFTSEAVTQLLVSELKMCFVRYDDGESRRIWERRDLKSPPQSPSGTRADQIRDGWSLEAEPGRCRIDTWARSCVPIRKRIVHPKGIAMDSSYRSIRRATSKSSTASVYVRSPSRGGTGGPASMRNTQTTDRIMEQSTLSDNLRSTAASKPQFIPLHDEAEEDEEEAAMREMKEREARRKREDEARVQKKAADEAEEADKLAEVKDLMKNKPFTYDTSGNIIWVQPMQAHKLPSPNPAPTYTFKKDAPPPASARTTVAPTRGVGNAKRTRGANAKSSREEIPQDSFKRFASQQPAMMEAMTMAPGVELAERGRSKRGQESHSRQHMSRSDYEEMGQEGRSSVSYGNKVMDKAKEVLANSPNPSPRTFLQPPAAGPGNRSLGQAAGPEGNLVSEHREKVGRSVDFAAEVVPVPPASPRPAQPVPPSTFRRAQLQRDALGYTLSTRRRVQTGTSSRFPNCGPPPPLGATMGHGLLHTDTREYYFPDAPALGLASNAGDEEISISISQQGLAPASQFSTPRGDHGQIVSKNPELARRLFPVR